LIDYAAAWRREQQRKRLINFYKAIFSKDSDDGDADEDYRRQQDRSSLDQQEDRREGDPDDLVPIGEHQLSRLADLVVEAADDPAVDRPAALRWLIYHHRGHQLARQHTKAL
jgi:hypothetical protein